MKNNSRSEYEIPEKSRAALEELVEQRTTELKTVLDAAGASMFRHDVATGHVALDQAWADLSGVRQDEFAQTLEAWTASLHQDDCDRIAAKIHDALASSATDMQAEYRLVHPDGEIRHIELRGIVLRDAEGVATELVGLNINVSERVNAREDIQKREAFLRATINNMPAEFWATDRALRYVIQNDRCRSSLGDQLGKTFEQLDISTDLKHQWREDNERVLAGKTVSQEYSFLVDGEERYFVGRVSPILLDGKVVGTIGTAVDVSERKAADESLHKSDAHLRTLMENMPVDFFAVDRDVRYTMQSNASKAAIGNVIGQRVDETDAPENLKKQWYAEHKQVLGGETIEREYHLPIGGDVRTYTAKISPVVVAGEIIGTVGSSMDITDRERMETALRIANDRLEERVQERTRELRGSERHLRDVFEGIVTAFSQAVEVRDPYTAGHQQRVSNLAAAIAKRLGLDAEHIQGTRVAGLLHDVGKMAIPSEILSKPSQLSPVEWSLIQQHPVHSANILGQIRFPWPVVEVVLQHHERSNGSGYPRGLRSEEILLEARIIAVADTVEAMASHRPYRASLGLDAAVTVIRSGKGTLYDPDVVGACVCLLANGDFTFDSVS